MNTMEFCLARVSDARKQIGSPQRMLLALSGGADSVALFCVLKELAIKEHFQLAAVHVHHGIRSTADRDEAFCKALCEDHQIPFFSMHVSLKKPSEALAREARYNAMAQVYSHWNADVVVTAHHREDQAETLLLHLFRGSGSKGLCGMKTYSTQVVSGTPMKIFRPLLAMDKEMLLSIAMEEIGRFCHDETNDSDCYTRNYIRRHVLPKVKERFPKAEEAIGRTANILQDENDYFEQEVNGFLQSYARTKAPPIFVDAAALGEVHVSLRRRIVQKLLPFDEMYETINRGVYIQSGQTVNLQKGWRMFATKARIYFIPPDITPCDACKNDLDIQSFCGKTGDGIRQQAMPLALYEACTFRYRKEGDYIKPFGMKGSKSLQDYLVDRKIDAPLRDYLPLLCIGNEVIWVIGVGASEKTRCTGTDEKIFVRYTPPLPYDKV